MCKVVALSGLRNTKCIEPTQLKTKHDHERPQCLDDYIQDWRKYRQESQISATPAVTAMLKMGTEMRLYVSWSRLRHVWLKTREDYDPDRADEDWDSSSDLLGDEEAYIPPEQETQLVEFFDHKVRQREEAMGWKLSTRSLTLLKCLIAPYLGFSYPLDAEATAGSGKVTRDMFHISWSKINVRGKEAYILQRYLGWGALAIAKKSQ